MTNGAWSRLKERVETKQRRMRTCFLESSKGFEDKGRALLSESERKQKEIMQTLVLQPPATRLCRLTAHISQCPFFSSLFPLCRQLGFRLCVGMHILKSKNGNILGGKKLQRLFNIDWVHFYYLKKKVAHKPVVKLCVDTIWRLLDVHLNVCQRDL